MPHTRPLELSYSQNSNWAIARAMQPSSYLLSLKIPPRIDFQLIENHKPISTLLFMIKVIEILIHSWFYSFLMKSNILYEN